MIAPADLTIVVTAYKIAEYLGACLASLEAAAVEGCAVLVVDDGSADGTGAVAQQWCAAGPNRRYLYQENAGVACARNRALDLVETAFVTFVDGDDVIPPGGIGALLAAGSPASDIVIGNRLRFYDDGRRPRPQMLFEDGADRPIQTVAFALRRLAIHGKLLRTALLREHAIRFPEGMVWEDLVFSYRLSAHAGLVATTAAIVYHWRQRVGDNPSVMAGSLMPHQIDSRFKQIQMCLEITTTPEWRLRFRKASLARDMSPHLMVHIRAIRSSPDPALARAGFERLRAGMQVHEAWIRRSARPPLRDDLVAVLDGRLDLLRPADEPAPAPAQVARASAARGGDRPSLGRRLHAAWQAFLAPPQGVRDEL